MASVDGPGSKATQLDRWQTMPLKMSRAESSAVVRFEINLPKRP